MIMPLSFFMHSHSYLAQFNLYKHRNSHGTPFK